MKQIKLFKFRYAIKSISKTGVLTNDKELLL